MAGLYNRTVSIYRQATQVAAGNVGYMGRDKTKETLVYSNLVASIQAPSIGSTRSGDDRLPYDAPGPARWNIFLPMGVAPIGTIKTRDIIVDDNNDRYQIAVAYANILGWKLQAIRLEA